MVNSGRLVMNEGRIKFEDYFDCAYLIHHIPHKNRNRLLYEELKRVGLLESGILKIRSTMPSPIDGRLKDLLGKHGWSNGYINVALEFRSVLCEIIMNEYRRVLVLENDVCFLKDLFVLERLIANAPSGCGVVQFSKFVNNADKFVELTRGIGEAEYFRNDGSMFYGGDCYSIDGSDAAIELLKFMDGNNGDNITPPDTLFNIVFPNRMIAVKNASIQLTYSKSMASTMYGKDSNHIAYKNQGIDYRDYNVPDGYDYGSFILDM